MAPDDKPNRLAESGLQIVVTTRDREPNINVEPHQLDYMGRKCSEGASGRLAETSSAACPRRCDRRSE